MPTNRQIKIRQFFSACMYVWRYCTIPPNLIPIMVLKTSLWAKPPNLMTANISGYTVISIRIKCSVINTIFLVVIGGEINGKRCYWICVG